MTTKLTTQQLCLIKNVTGDDTKAAARLQMQIESQLKDVTIAYILGAILGGLGVHRMYAGQIMLGIIQFITVCMVFGVVWVLADVFLTKGVIEAANDKIVQDAINAYEILK